MAILPYKVCRSTRYSALRFFHIVEQLLNYRFQVFFVLRKKHNQITFLHVYHHIGMVAGMWLGIRYVGGGSSIHLPLLNTFVHTVMYTYYLLSAWSTDMKQNLWWKKYITQLQIVSRFSILCLS